MPVHPSLLLQFPLLQELTKADLEGLALRSSVHEYSKREVVLEKGAGNTHMGFLLEGKLQMVDFTIDGKEVGIRFIDRHQYFGEIALIDSQAQPEMVIASKKSTVIKTPAMEFRTIMFGTPSVAEKITMALAQRIRSDIKQRQLLGIANPVQRICTQLESLGQTDATGQLRIVNVPTHQELAIMVNLSRETVTRTFQVLQSHGGMQRDGDDLVLNPSQMRSIYEK